MNHLPDELLKNILNRLGHKDRLASRFVCRRFFEVPVYFPFCVDRALGLAPENYYDSNLRCPKDRKKMLVRILKAVSKKIIRGDPGIAHRLRNPRLVAPDSYIFSLGICFYEKHIDSDPAVRYVFSAIRSIELSIDPSVPLATRFIQFIDRSPFVNTLNVLHRDWHPLLFSISHPERISRFINRGFSRTKLSMFLFNGFADHVAEIYLCGSGYVDEEIDGRLFLFKKLRRLDIGCNSSAPRLIHPMTAECMPGITRLTIRRVPATETEAATELIPFSEICRMTTLEKITTVSPVNLVRGVSMGNLTRLKRLEIVISEMHTDERLGFLAPLASTLKVLNLTFLQLREGTVDMSVLKRFPVLKSLNLNVDARRLYGPRVIQLRGLDTFFRPLETCVRRLERIDIDGFDVKNWRGLSIAVTNDNPFHPTRAKDVRIFGCLSRLVPVSTLKRERPADE